MRFGFDISFENLHKSHKKCTPTQIAEYQIALNLHKILNNDEPDLSFEKIMILDQIVCTSRQINVQFLRNFNTKIGLNTTGNKFYYINSKVSFDRPFIMNAQSVCKCINSDLFCICFSHDKICLSVWSGLSGHCLCICVY